MKEIYFLKGKKLNGLMSSTNEHFCLKDMFSTFCVAYRSLLNFWQINLPMMFTSGLRKPNASEKARVLISKYFSLTIQQHQIMRTLLVYQSPLPLGQ